MKWKIAAFIIILLLYPLFLRWVHMTDLRAIPIIVPYCLAALSVIIIFSEMIGAIAALLSKKKS
ncbi:hypothetical protein ACFQI7_10960 [Paenibacillus allorhizosphaerae]|uniref:Uncharacterized protein n=1 Tax=Paenibacillus allorhizosphaerae TaxID=2849866 RepID=A0ABN7TK79_9BACL|nr:hypothetical protein [Paenibacillus allorhizosphaerae]CAG7642732.1 hypothetical protein PAECIP111802_02895 [Paenibacillus allorhizosphaerae]